VLDPAGWVALRERRLLYITTLLMLIVVIPVCVLTVYVAYKFRKSNKEAKYAPNWDYSLLVESIWWGIPCIIIAILSILTYQSCHELDPFRPIQRDAKPLSIQVVALQWKWLFIYPEENIATVNYVQFPKDRPLQFEITSDAPMNSFWIPRLGGQIYAMPGMRTKLHLIADSIGDFPGSSANLSGKGFSGMRFVASASTQEGFDRWVSRVKKQSAKLDQSAYELLAKPSENNPVATYVLAEKKLFDQIIMKYME
jgi:cytochrome o ubiquinol oxidase subunit 2